MDPYEVLVKLNSSGKLRELINEDEFNLLSSEGCLDSKKRFEVFHKSSDKKASKNNEARTSLSFKLRSIAYDQVINQFWSSEFEPVEASRDAYVTNEEAFEEWKKVQDEKKQKNKAHVRNKIRPSTSESQNEDGDESPREKDGDDDNDRNSSDDEKDKGSKRRKKDNRASMSNRELRNLLSDSTITKAKKWQTIHVDGQTELYESCEKVLAKLKDYHEHSYPFLTRVRKSDAPDYYDIISNPMDLGTMTKKLNRNEYVSKADFQSDLTLIISNCRTFNTDPSSKIYLQHADAFEKKVKELMKTVRNIDLAKNLELVQESPTHSSNEKEDKTKEKSKEKEKEKIAKEKEKNNKDKKKTDKKIQKEDSKDGESSEPPKKKRNVNQDTNDEEMTEPILKTNSDKEEAVLGTPKTRLDYTNFRIKQTYIPFGERQAIVRTQEDMELFTNPGSFKILKLDELETDMSASNMSTSELDQLSPRKVYQLDLLPEYQFSSCVPNTGKAKDSETEKAEKIDYSHLDQTIARVLRTCGFDAIEGSAMESLEGIVSDSLVGFIAQIKKFHEHFNETNSLEELVSHFLKTTNSNLNQLKQLMK